MRVFRKPLTEAEQIENIRKSITFVDRYRYWMSLFYLALMLIIFGTFSKVILWIINMPQQFPNNPAPNQNIWVWSGFTLGTILGFGFMKSAYYLIEGIMMPFTGMRNERLLLKYHDESHGTSEIDLVEQSADNPFQQTSYEPEPSL